MEFPEKTICPWDWDILYTRHKKQFHTYILTNVNIFPLSRILLALLLISSDNHRNASNPENPQKVPTYCLEEICRKFSWHHAMRDIELGYLI